MLQGGFHSIYICFFGLLLFACNVSCKPVDDASATDVNYSPTLPKPLAAIVESKIDSIDSLVNDATIVEGLRLTNQVNQNLTQKAILARDKAWRAAEEDDLFIKAMLDNPCSLRLKTFQKEHPEISEIFITDAGGLNACLSNKTTDYLQSDEEWWQRTADASQPYRYSGLIEFDESAKTRAIPVYIRRVSENSGQLLFIVKAILSIKAIEDEL